MPRAKSSSRTELVDNALKTFWTTGYHVVSMGDLVRETGVSRGGIYSDFAGKEALFHACLHRYQDRVVTPVFAQVEAEGAGLEAIRGYLDRLLARFEANQGFGIGCLVLNTLAQIAPEDQQTRALLDQHITRLATGFRNALTNEAATAGGLDENELQALTEFTLISIHGLWSFSRTTADVTLLRQYCEIFLDLLQTRLHSPQAQAR
ncbi:Copper outer membrane regulator [Phaeobacter sp. CECT 5382]|uniref:TetR/AcrR family transcriptional regulator n=1 Tax=Phaeobacter sp. CECT 5382 TaxID=1712645 RepID=UPI0006DBD3E6|nr:TetR/AcrR family transcriptional regulator [Phaeobacter sp. CECT 5382]CUH86690.1 Copper outer membrane regulator [Phaeobacter sp. CECT 5382]